MPAKMAQISPLGRRSGCQDYGRRPRRQAVLSKRGNSAKIHPGLGFIWGIPALSPLPPRFSARWSLPDAAGGLRPYAAAIRSSVTRRRML
jgi:hypothetical protein